MKRLVLILLIGLMPCICTFAQDAADSLVFSRFLHFSAKEKLSKKPLGTRVATIGQFFLETPYVGSTLEKPGAEQLQVNLHELDCTTLVENALALSRLLNSNTQDFEAFKTLLSTIRYRSGKLNGYTSRLHYATDWITDNVQKGFLTFVPLGTASTLLHPQVSYMSTHPTAYAALKANSTLIPILKKQEDQINQQSLIYLPKANVSEQAPQIQSGDIIAISTSMNGLDFSHLGIAIRQKGNVYLLHASSAGKKVLISEKTLSDYLAGIKKHTGIVVLRPI